MYFRYPQTSRVLNVEDSFAHLSSVNDSGDLEFEFTYSLSQRALIDHKGQVVKVTVTSRHIGPKQLLSNSHRGAIDTVSLVKNIRSQVSDAKVVQKQQETYVIASTISDVMAYVNNDVIPQLRARASTRDIPYFNKPRLHLVPAADLKQAVDARPILQRVALSSIVPDVATAVSSSINEDTRSLSLDMITRQGIDPTNIVHLTPRSQSEYETRGGLTNAARTQELVTDPASRLCNYHHFPPAHPLPPTTSDQVPDQEHVQVIQTVPDDSVTVMVDLTIPQRNLVLDRVDVTHVFVTFELLDSQTGQAIDTVTKDLDLTRHLQVYNTPKVAPQVKAVSSDVSTRVNLEIKQVDAGASGVQVYKKPVWSSSTDISSYTLIGSYDVTSRDQSLLVQVERPQRSAIVYRVVPIGAQSTQGFEFNNVAIKPARYSPIKSVALSVTQVDTGIKLECRNIPHNVVAIQFLKWNMTTFDSSYTTVNDDVGFVDDASRQTDLVVTIDASVAAANIYRYVARLIYLDGTTQDFGDATVEFIQPAPGQVDTVIDHVVVGHDSQPNVTFSINTSTLDTDIDVVKNMLASQNLTEYFTGDIAAQRDQLKNLIAHSVQRIDLTTGKREDFGVLTAPSFDDSALRKNQAIDPLKYGHKYRYEVCPLLRAPETLFDDFTKEAVDAVTKKSYTYNPAKFLHPLALTRGVVVTSAGAAQRYAKAPMAYGVVGSVKTIDVSFDSPQATVVDASVSRFDRHLNVINWKVNGDIDQVDHFIIMKQVHGVLTMVGKAHSEFVYGSCQYVHPVTAKDNGVISYVITPVMIDYRLGPQAATNTVLVEAP